MTDSIKDNTAILSIKINLLAKIKSLVQSSPSVLYNRK